MRFLTWSARSFQFDSHRVCCSTDDLWCTCLLRAASLCCRWVELRRKPPSERKLALLLYGFPPGVGATGTAALLNVPKSIEKMIAALQVKEEAADVLGQM